MRRKLKPNGFLIFETGNIPDVTAANRRIFLDYQYPDHLYFFGETAESLAAAGVRPDAQIATVDVDLGVAIAEPALAIAD